MSKSYTGGTNFNWPTADENDWESTVDDALDTISGHDHTGAGNGTPIPASGIADNAITTSKIADDAVTTAKIADDAVTGALIRLNNNQALRGRNAANSADVDMFKLATTDIMHLLTGLVFASSETLSGNGNSQALSMSTVVTISNKGAGGGLALTLPDGVNGQFKLLVSINAAPVTCTPTNGPTIRLYQNSWVLYYFMNTRWWAITGPGAVNTSDTETLTGSGAISLTVLRTVLNGASLAMTLADGVDGQVKYITNIASTAATVTPATTAGANTVSIGQNGTVIYVFQSGEWRAILGGTNAQITDDIETLIANGAASVSTKFTILDGSSLAVTLANGAVGQEKYFFNNASSTATVTPGNTSRPNTVSIASLGWCQYRFFGGEWIVIPGPGCAVIDDIQAITASSGTYTVTTKTITFNNAGATTATFNAGFANQEVYVYNIGAGTVTLTLTGRPAATDVATIVTGGSLHLVMINSLWQPFAGVGCTLA